MSIERLQEQLSRTNRRAHEYKAESKSKDKQIKRFKEKIAEISSQDAQMANKKTTIETLEKQEQRLQSSIETLTNEEARLKLIFDQRRAMVQSAADSEINELGQNERLSAYFELTGVKDELEQVKRNLALHEDALEIGEGEEDCESCGQRWLSHDEAMVPTQFRRTTFTSVKRKALEELYEEQGAEKRMRPTEELHSPSLKAKSLEGVCNYYLTAQCEVLREAGRGGLINPIHFDITKFGLLCISKFGLERIKVYQECGSQAAMSEQFTKAQDATLSTAVRGVLHKYDFFKYGHRSVFPLQEKMQQQEYLDLPVATLKDLVVEIEKCTRKEVESVRDIATRIAKIPQHRLHEIRMNEVMPLMISLSGSYQDKTLKPGQSNLIKDQGLFSGQLERVLRSTVAGYKALYVILRQIQSLDPVPGHYFAPTASTNTGQLIPKLPPPLS